jgi:hypothetical protein
MAFDLWRSEKARKHHKRAPWMTSALWMSEAPIWHGYAVPVQMTPTEAAFASSATGAVCSYLLGLAGHIKK